MTLTVHEHLYGIDGAPLGTTLAFGLGVYFGPNRIMAARALHCDDDREDADDGNDDTMFDDGAMCGNDLVMASRPFSSAEGPNTHDNVAGNVGVLTEIDNLRVVASVEGSMDYQRLYQEIQAHYVKFTLIEDESALVKETSEEPPHQQSQSIFLQQLRDIKQRAEHNLGQHVEISAISLPSYWFDELKNAMLEAATQLNMVIPRDMLLSHEETARLAYNLGDRKNQGTWFLVLIEYNTRNLYLTFTEMNDLDDPEDHPQYPVDGQYLLENLGEDSCTRARSHAEHYTNIKKALDQFLLNHVAKDPDNIDESRDQTLSEFPYSDIKGNILTGDASEEGMRAMDKILREVFADLPQCASGNLFTQLRPSHVVALGTARAVRSKMVNDDILNDVYEPLDIED